MKPAQIFHQYIWIINTLRAFRHLTKRLVEKIFDLRPTPPILKHLDLVTGDTGDS